MESCTDWMGRPLNLQLMVKTNGGSTERSIVKTDLLLNTLMESKNGGLMASVIVKMARPLSG